MPSTSARRAIFRHLVSPTQEQTLDRPVAPRFNRFRAASIDEQKATIRRRVAHTHTRADLVKVVVRSALLK